MDSNAFVYRKTRGEKYVFFQAKIHHFCKVKKLQKGNTEINHIRWEYEQGWDPTVACA
jgi:hypothetical protein